MKFRKAIDKMYDSICTITTFVEYEKPNGVTAFKENVLVENEPCHVSQTSITKAVSNDGVQEIEKIINLYLRPELKIPAGCRILVKYNGITLEYKSSGIPSYYDAFQKIQLDFVSRWT